MRFSGLNNRVQFLDQNDKQPYVDRHIRLLSSYDIEPPIYTALGFSPRGSNVSDSDVSNAFKAFGIDSPWHRLSAIATAIGNSRVSLSDDYKALARTRHSSAHNPSGNVTSSDLSTNIELAIVIGIAIDVLTSAIAATYVKARNPAQLNASIGTIGYSFRFVDEQPDGSWVERFGQRTVKAYPSESAAYIGAIGRRNAGRVVARDVRKVPLAILT